MVQDNRLPVWIQSTTAISSGGRWQPSRLHKTNKTIKIKGEVKELFQILKDQGNGCSVWGSKSGTAGDEREEEQTDYT